MPAPNLAHRHIYSDWEDPAGYLIAAGGVSGPGNHTPGQLRHARPYLVSGQRIFVFPVGVEGFTRTGQATLALHRPIGGRRAKGMAIHYEEARITLSGTFPGTLSIDTMNDCLTILTNPSPDPGLRLYAPGVFEHVQFLLPETWNFEHADDDRSHSIGYNISFVLIGEGKDVNDPKGDPPAKNPGYSTTRYGKPKRTFVVADGARTLRAVAAFVYHDASKWQKLVDLNRGELAIFMRSMELNKAQHLPSYQLPTYRWPIGTRFRYE